MLKDKEVSVKRTILNMPSDLKERVRKFRFANEIDSEAEAIRLLIETGLDAMAKKSARKTKGQGDE